MTDAQKNHMQLTIDKNYEKKNKLNTKNRKIHRNTHRIIMTKKTTTDTKINKPQISASCDMGRHRRASGQL